MRERVAYGAIGWLTLVFFPLFLLVWIQLRFLCVQDEAITWFHRVVVLADTIAIWVFVPAALRMERQRRRRSGNGNWRARWGIWLRTRPRALREAWWGLKDLVVAVVLISMLGLAALAASVLAQGTPTKAKVLRRKREPATRRKPVTRTRRALREWHPIWPVWVANLAALLFAFLIGTFPHERLEDALVKEFDANHLTRLWVTMTPTEADQIAAAIAGHEITEAISSRPFSPYAWSEWIAGYKPSEFGEPDGTEPLARHIRDSLPVNPDFPYRHLSITSALLGHPDGGIRLYRAFRLNGAELVAGNPDAETLNLIRNGSREERKKAMAQVHGLDLRGRSLTYALLEDALLPKAQLNGACMDAARLEGAILDEAKLGRWLPRSGEVEGEAAYPACERRQTPADTSLRHVDLHAAQLQGANLSRAQLQGANLSRAQLQGADLSRAQLQGADLSRAQLQGANLRQAQLQGADLGLTQLQGAFLGEARLQGANLDLAQLQGTFLVRARLQAASLGLARLQGADLRFAVLHGANFQRSSLYYTDMTGSRRRKLSQKQIGTILQELSKRLADSEVDADLAERIWTTVADRLCERKGQEGTWEQAHQHEHLFCEGLDGGPGCITDTDTFKRGQAQIFARIACSYDWAAQRMAWRILGLRTNAYAHDFEKERELAIFSPSRNAHDWERLDVRPALQRMLGDDCAGAKSLSDEDRSVIRTVIAQLDAKFGPATETAAATDPPAATSADPEPHAGAPR